MAHDSKRGFFSSLFGNRKQKELEETARLESKHRLEERIEQVLLERVAVPVFLVIEEKHAAAISQEEAEPEVELLPISASVIPRRKAPAQAAFVLQAFEASRSYASSER